MNRLIPVVSIALLLILALVTAAPSAAADAPRTATVHVATAAPAGGDDQPVHRERKVVVLSGDGASHPVVLEGLSGAYLGVELTQLTPELRTHFGVPDDRGVMIGRVEEDSPAAGAGLAVGDIVTAIDGDPVDSTWDLSIAVRRHDGGDAVDLSVWRDGRSLDVNATLGERKREQIDLGRLLPDGQLPKVKGLHWVQEDGLEGDDGKETRIIVRPEIVHELGKSLDEVDWPMLDGRLRARNRELEERLEQLETKLDELEKRLDETVPER